MKQILVSGSSAYDNLMKFDGNFKSEFSGKNLSSAINMSILSSSLEKNHGGTGANIAYNLALLGESPILLSSVGDDYSFSDVISEKVNLKYIHRQQFSHSAQSMILSDSDDNRITVFHPGAMKYAGESKIQYVQEDIGLAIVSANDIPTMLEHMRAVKAKEIKLIADPSQQISQMSKEQLRECVHLGDILILNHFEYTDLQRRAGLSQDDLYMAFETIVITYGAQGSELFHKGEMSHIPAIEVSETEDTTGAGDSYRAGYIYGTLAGLDNKTSCQLGTVLASYNVISPGSQQHHFSLGGVMEDLKTYFGVEIDLYQKRKS